MSCFYQALRIVGETLLTDLSPQLTELLKKIVCVYIKVNVSGYFACMCVCTPCAYRAQKALDSWDWSYR